MRYLELRDNLIHDVDHEAALSIYDIEVTDSDDRKRENNQEK
jgi:hypothetical protein